MPKPIADRFTALSVLNVIEREFTPDVYRATIVQSAYSWAIEVEGDRASVMQRLATRWGWVGTPPVVSGDEHQITTVWTSYHRRVEVRTIAVERVVKRHPGVAQTRGLEHALDGP